MKALILLLITLSAQAQVAWFPVGKEGANTNWATQQLCEESEQHACVDVGRCPLDECDPVDEEIDGPERWSNPFNVTPCQPEEACKEMLPTLCTDGKSPFYRNMGAGFEAYCAFKLVTPKIKTGRKIVVANASKKELKRQAREELLSKLNKKKVAKEALKDLDAQLESATTIKDLKKIIKLLLDAQD